MKSNMKAKIIKLVRQGMKVSDIADKLGTSVSYIYMVRKEMIKDVLTTDETRLKNAVATISRADMVNHPPHYTAGGIETIDFIEAKQLGYNLGNVVKYVSRNILKGDQLENLKKAQWYLNREINNITKDLK
jgi:hypothetical protein